MSDIPSFPYELLWGERVVRRREPHPRRRRGVPGAGAARVPVRTSVTTFPLEEANEALGALRAGTVEGALALEI